MAVRRVVPNASVHNFRVDLFEDFISHGPIHSAVFGECSPATLLRISRTCRLSRALVISWINLAYNIEKFLSSYFHKQEIIGFRQLQLDFGLVISGSAALQFFDRTRYPDSDLDIYVEVKHARDVGRWLITHGYEFRPDLAAAEDTESDEESSSTDSSGDEVAYGVLDENHWMTFEEACDSAWDSRIPEAYRNDKISRVFNMRKGDQCIQLIGARWSPLDVILSYHSTCVMNFITHEAAYSLYPLCTFEDRKSLVVHSTGSVISQSGARVKYQGRGWEMTAGQESDLSSASHKRSGFGGMTRYVGDRYTWRIPFSIKSLRIPDFMLRRSDEGLSLSLPFITSNSWKLLIRPPNQSEEPHTLLPYPLACCASTRFVSDALKFVYVISDTLPVMKLEEAFKKERGEIFEDSLFNDTMEELYSAVARAD